MFIETIILMQCKQQMKKILFTIGLLFSLKGSWAQSITLSLTKAFEKFERDTQLGNAIASLYVLDAKAGSVVFHKNEKIGLAPASTQKIITSASAYELLGKDFRYKTSFGYEKDKDSVVALSIIPGGDPTFGSWRYSSTNETTILQNSIAAFKESNIKNFGAVALHNDGWESETIPDGWIWQDIGNYYGAGAKGLNWRENQFDLLLKSGKNIGDAVEIVGTVPKLINYTLHSMATSAAKGSGDNAYIYFPLTSSEGIVRGTIPVNENRFVISGAMSSAPDEFVGTLLDTLVKIGIVNSGTVAQKTFFKKRSSAKPVIIYTHYSPPLDSIIFWFNRRSINLYGEALVKTIAFQKKGIGTTDDGVEIIKDYWKSKGIPQTELNMVDGSGLSPLNRVTTQAQVTILQYAKAQSWFPHFYLSLPEFNGMKMKSGTIRSVKGFCGYHTAKNGKDYIFSFLVNNYNGSSSALVQKMYEVLNELK